jgi:hypothetical protein
MAMAKAVEKPNLDEVNRIVGGGAPNLDTTTADADCAIAVFRGEIARLKSCLETNAERQAREVEI